MLRIIALLLLCLVSAGCALGNLTAIHKGSSIAPSSSTEQTGPYGLFIGAKQRAVISNTVADESIVYQYDNAGKYIGATTTVSKKRVVCAEPSPDALSAVSAQTGISISRLSTAISGNTGLSEAAANIGLRTQTIQTLRDGFYRVCEAQMNGLDKEQYAMMLRRFQTNMIALLAIEQLTSTVTGPDVALASTAGDAFSMKAIYEQQAANQSNIKTQREEQLNQVMSKLTPLEAKKAECGTLPADTDPKPDGCKDAQVAARESEITSLKDQQTALNKQITDAESERGRFAELATSATDGADPRTSAVSTSTRFAVNPTAEVADAVESITLRVLNQDYGTTMCIDYLRSGNANGAEDECESILKAYASRISFSAQTDLLNAQIKADQLQNRRDVLGFQMESMRRVRETVLADGKIEPDEVALLQGLLGIKQQDLLLGDAAPKRKTPNKLAANQQAQLFIQRDAPEVLSDILDGMPSERSRIDSGNQYSIITRNTDGYSFLGGATTATNPEAESPSLPE